MERSATRQAIVVVCIISLVAALLAGPVIGAIRASSRQICQDNLRAIWKALKAYQADYGAYPPIDNGGVPLRPWPELILPFGLAKSALVCPGQDLKKEAWVHNPNYPYSYAINSNALADNPWGGLHPTMPINFDKLLLVADGYWTWFAYDDSWDPRGLDPLSPHWWSNKVAWRHPRPEPYSSTRAGTNSITVSGQVVTLRRPVNTSQYIINLGPAPAGAAATALRTPGEEAR